jgi:RHS repeat-associated protein
LSETQNVSGGPGAKTVGYSYDANGNRMTLGYPGGSSISYGYTGRNQLNGIISGSITAGYSYDLNGNRLSKTLGNSTNTSYGYDDANRLLNIDNQTVGASFARFDYAYNSVNNRMSRTETDNGAAPSADLYGYDVVDQLTQVKYNFDATANNQDRLVAYDYDAAGNRAMLTDNGAQTPYSTNNLNEYTAAGTLTANYDANGNLQTTSGFSWTYDAGNRLTAGTGLASFAAAYDARNRCVSRTINGATAYFYYDGWNLIQECDASGGEIARYVHGIRVDELVARITPVGTSYYYHDAPGSTIALSDGSGNVTERYSYDVYGAPAFKGGNGNAVSSSATGNRFLFTGREYIQEIALYDYRNRFYSAVLGRFLQTDSKRFTAGDANLYRYVTNNPVSRSDPTGLAPVGLPDGSVWDDGSDCKCGICKKISGPSEPDTNPPTPGPAPTPDPPPSDAPPGAGPQDGICSGIAYPLNVSSCALACCAQHDACYAANGCQQNSWRNPGRWPACDRCNNEVAVCIAGCIANH